MCIRDRDDEAEPLAADAVDRVTRSRRWSPGMDVEHTEHGPGWVWGSGRDRVTVRFETADTPPGPVRTFSSDDPDLRPRLPGPVADPVEDPAAGPVEV